MEEKVFSAGDFTVTMDGKHVTLTSEGVDWCLTLGNNIGMAKSIRMMLEDEEYEEEFAILLFEQIFTACTIIGDQQYIKDRIDADTALIGRIEEFIKGFASRKDADTVVALASEAGEG